MDSEHGSGSSKSPRTDAEAIDKNGNSLAQLISLVDSEHESGSGTDTERKLNEKEFGPVKSTKSSHSVSSSSSSSDDFFQVNPKVLLGLSASPVASRETDGDVKLLLRHDNIDDCNDPSFKHGESLNESAGSISRVSDVTFESLLPIMSQMQSPPTQVMDRNEGYDPNRIPASIFASKPATPMDWSVASSESLFSIHIGNNSFSRDHVFMMGGDLFKSGELYKSGELHKPEELYSSRELQIFGELNRSRELIKIRQSSLAAKDSDMKKTMDEQRNCTISGVTDETQKNVLNGCVNDHGELNVEEPRNSSSKHRSDGSGTSGQSFAFPIKKKKKKKCACTSCHCSNCSWTFCYCIWSSCCYKWSSCHCKWTGCSCKCLSWPGCSCKWVSWPSCSFKCLSCPGCCKCPSWGSCCCKWPSCRCKCPSLPCCHYKCPSLPCCHYKCPTWPSSCCKCPTWSSRCCKCPRWPSCKCQCSNCSWAFCCCWDCNRKTVCSSTYNSLTDGGIELSGKEQHILQQSSPKVLKATPRSWCSCLFFCSCCFC